MTQPSLLYFDANTLLSFACEATAGGALVSYFGGSARVPQIVKDELRHLQTRRPPLPNTNRALGLAAKMTVEPIDTHDDLDLLATYRDLLASPSDHPRNHPG